MFLWVPSVSKWHSHPFAPAWDNTPLDEDMSRLPTRKMTEKKKQDDEEIVVEETVEEKKTVTILVSRRDGFTHALAKKVEEAGGTLEISAWVEGPYTSKFTCSILLECMDIDKLAGRLKRLLCIIWAHCAPCRWSRHHRPTRPRCGDLLSALTIPCCGATDHDILVRAETSAH